MGKTETQLWETHSNLYKLQPTDHAHLFAHLHLVPPPFNWGLIFYTREDLELRTRL